MSSLGGVTHVPGQMCYLCTRFVPAGQLTINSNDPNNPTVSVLLTGNGVQLDPAAIELVLDRSGSMSGAAPGGTKIDALRSAVRLFADLLIPGQGDEVGAVEFDDQVDVLAQFATFDANQQSTIEADANGITPRNMTSIGGGLQLGQTQLGAATVPRRILLVFTDGMENTAPAIANVEPGIVAAGTEIYAIGLGQSQNISSAALSTLAASANGKFFQTDDTLILRKNFVQVLADAFRQNIAADPVLNLAQGQAVDVPVWITQCERRISFILNWDNPASQVDFTLEAPDGTLFSPNSTHNNQLVVYGEGHGYRYYQIAFPPIDPGSGLAIGPARLGLWRMRLRGTNLADAAERCVTSVAVESDLKMTVSVSASDIYKPVSLTVRIELNGAPLSDADVEVTVTSPTKSLAQAMTPAIVQKALQADLHPIASNQKLVIPTVKKKYKLTAKDRLFQAELPPPRIDGVYEFEIHAIGKGCGGTFERYAAFSRYVGGNVDKRRSSVTVTHTGPTAATVSVGLRDKRGMPLAPGSVAIRAAIKGGAVRNAHAIALLRSERHVNGYIGHGQP